MDKNLPIKENMDIRLVIFGWWYGAKADCFQQAGIPHESSRYHLCYPQASQARRDAAQSNTDRLKLFLHHQRMVFLSFFFLPTYQTFIHECHLSNISMHPVAPNKVLKEREKLVEFGNTNTIASSPPNRKHFMVVNLMPMPL